MKTVSNIILLIGFLALIIGTPILFLNSEKLKISYNENRSLAKAPELSLEKIENGKWMSQVNKYAIDHFPFRDFWVRTYFRWQMVSDQTFVHKYIIGEDGWTYPKPINYFPKKNMSKSIKQMGLLEEYTTEHDVKLFYISAPDRKNVLPIPYPDHINSLWKKNKAYLLGGFKDKGVNVIDIGAQWLKEHDPDELYPYYWRTDHHWNINGAFYGYQVIREQLAERFSIGSPVDKENYVKTCRKGIQFDGSYNKQLYELVDDPDPICYINNKTTVPSDYEYYIGDEETGTKVKKSSIYGIGESEHPDMVDYGEAYAGDRREITIVNNTKKKDIRTLVIKDSYANITLPFMAEMSHVTTFYDLRYNKDRTLKEYLEKNEFDRIMILYNGSTIFNAMYEFGF